MHRLLRTRVLVPCGVALLVLSGCFGSPPTHFYLVPALTSGDTAPPASAGQRDLTLGVGPVTVPPYLDRPQLVTRTSRAKLALADFDQWAGPLADTIARVLAEDLSLLLPTERVVLYPWSRALDPDYQITVEVLQFDRGPGGEVVLAARWSLLDRDGQERVLRTARLSQTAGGADYEAMVTAMGRTLEALAQEMVTTLRSLAPPAPRAHRSTIESKPSASKGIGAR
jgi:uncharacterized protein